MISNPSPQQLAVKDALLNTNYSIFVNSTAGSGKTTTLVWLLSFITNKSVLCCAFNKEIKDELEARCKKFNNVKVSTLHALGYGMMKKQFGCGDPNPTKYRKIFIDMQSKWDVPTDDRDFTSRITDLIDLLRLFVFKTKEDAINIAKTYNISNDFNEVKIAIEVIEVGRKITKDIDYTDMVYLPVYHNLAAGYQYDYLVLDESQDLNKCQREFVFRFLKTGGRSICFGDKFQCIYSFAGADINSFNILKNRPNTKALSLSVTYRCPISVVNYIRREGINDEIESHDKSIQGRINFKAEINDIKPGDIVICRNNMPIAKLCIQFLEEGKKAFIRGKDIGANLIRLIEKTRKSSMVDANNWLKEDLAKLKQKMMRKYRLPESDILEMPEYDLYKDKISTISALTFGCKSVSDAIMKIRNIFQDKTNEGIILSTVHKAKGLEYDNVFIVCDWLMPSKHAKTDMEKIEERNIQFVAYSRCKKTLNFIPRAEFDPYKKNG